MTVVCCWFIINSVCMWTCVYCANKCIKPILRVLKFPCNYCIYTNVSMILTTNSRLTYCLWLRKLKCVAYQHRNQTHYPNPDFHTRLCCKRGSEKRILIRCKRTMRRYTGGHQVVTSTRLSLQVDQHIHLFSWRRRKSAKWEKMRMRILTSERSSHDHNLIMLFTQTYFYTFLGTPIPMFYDIYESEVSTCVYQILTFSL